jgi:hypothetical protein
MTREAYYKSLSRRCGVLGVEPPAPSMAAAYQNAGYSPREAAGLELDEYIQFKRTLKQHELYSQSWCETQGDNH